MMGRVGLPVGAIGVDGERMDDFKDSGQAGCGSNR